MTADLSGEGRRALAARIVAAFDEVSRGADPLWVSLEAPSGWGKTRIVQEVYAQLATTRQSETGQYWPAALTATTTGATDILRDRKTVSPPQVEREPDSVPAFFWWGISAFERNGIPSIALAQDLRQFDGHLPFLVARCKQLSRLREKGATGARELGAIALEEARDELTSAVLDLAGLGLPGVGFVWRLGAWTAGKISSAQRERRMVAQGSTIREDHGQVAADAYETIQSVSRPGLPTVIVVEDLQYADATLIDLLSRLLGSGKPILVVTTAWPGVFADAGPLARIAAAGTHVVRLSTVEEPPAGWPDMSSLDEFELASIVRSHYPLATDRTIAGLIARSDNPLQLKLLCTLPSIARRARDGVLDLDPSVIEALPPSLDGMYEQMWTQLPPAVRESLALALCGIPTDLDRANGDDRWDAELLARVARALFPAADGVIDAIDSAQTGYAWAELVEDALRVFPDEANRRVVEQRRPEFYSQLDIDRIRTELTRVIGEDLGDDALPESIRQHRAALLLALSAEGFGVDPDALTAAAGLQTELLEAVDESGRVLEILDQISAGYAPATHPASDSDEVASPGQPPLRAHAPLSAGLAPMSPELRIRRAVALATSGRPRAAADELDAVISDLESRRGVEDAVALDARIERAAIVLRAPRSDEESIDVDELRRTVERVFGPADPRVLRLIRMERMTASIDGFHGLPDVVTDAGRYRVKDLSTRFGAVNPELVAFLRLMAEQARSSGYPDAAATFLDGQAHDLADAVGGTHPEVLRLRLDRARCLVDVGRTEEAFHEAEVIRTAFIAAGGPQSDDAIDALIAMISAESAAERSNQRASGLARLLLDEARATADRTSLVRLRIAVRLSELDAEDGPGDDDIRDLFELLDTASPVLGEADADIGALRHALAETLLETGYAESALSLAEAGARLCARHRAQPLTWSRVMLLGRCHEMLGQAAEAVTAYVFVAEAAEDAVELAARSDEGHPAAEATAARARARIALVQRLSPTGWYPSADIDVRPTTETHRYHRRAAWQDEDFFADDSQMLLLAQHLHGRSLIHGPADHVALDLLRTLRRFHFTHQEHEPALILTRQLFALVPLPLYGRLSGASEVDDAERWLLANAAVQSASSIGRPEEAIAIIDDVLALAESPEDLTMLLKDKADLLAEEGRIDDALETLASARTHARSIERVLVVESALNLLEDHGRYTEAVELARSELAEPDVDAPELLVGKISWFLQADGRPDEAIATLSAAIDDPALAGHHDGLRSSRAWLRAQAGDDEGAVDDLHDVLRANPDDEFANVALVAPLLRLDRREEASRRFLEAVGASQRAGHKIIDFTLRERVIEMVTAFGEASDAVALAEEYLLHLESANLGWIESTLRSNGERLLAAAHERAD
ncbi:hypothetical protein [Microbacterium sp.]|uniref:tetratricopeptide repeat protein n=1 Tax=Microbacterium sp. TaxID=51671 RepID=UPI003F70C54D